MAALATHSVEMRGEELVGPSIGKDLRWAAFKAIFWSLLIIVGYIWVRFGRHGLGFGLGAILTLTHDVLLTLGIFSVLGLEIDATFIAAILTLVGYSLNDTIVVFDRIRENTDNLANVSYTERVNTSVNQSFSRTVITSGTTLFTTAVIAIFGGEGLATFAWALTIGVLVGTYSSIFVSAPFVNWWVNRRVAPRS
jgi:SecD/SecF fusion protein